MKIAIDSGFVRTCDSCATHTCSPPSSPLAVISRVPRSYDPDPIPLSDPGLDCMACLQQAAYKCCYECFSDKSSKREWVQRCLEACQTKVQRTETIIQGELIQFQVRDQCLFHETLGPHDGKIRDTSHSLSLIRPPHLIVDAMIGF